MREGGRTRADPTHRSSCRPRVDHRGPDGLRRLPEPPQRVRNLRPGAVDEQSGTSTYFTRRAGPMNEASDVDPSAPVVVGCDGSAGSGFTIGFGIQEARRQQTSLLILTAFERPIDPDIDSFDVPEDQLKRRAQSRAEAFLALAVTRRRRQAAEGVRGVRQFRGSGQVLTGRAGADAVVGVEVVRGDDLHHIGQGDHLEQPLTQLLGIAVSEFLHQQEPFYSSPDRSKLDSKPK